MENQHETKLIGDILAENEDEDQLLNALKLDSEDLARLQNRASTAPPIGVFSPIVNSNSSPDK